MGSIGPNVAGSTWQPPSTSKPWTPTASSSWRTTSTPPAKQPARSPMRSERLERREPATPSMSP